MAISDGIPMLMQRSLNVLNTFLLPNKTEFACLQDGAHLSSRRSSPVFKTRSSVFKTELACLQDEARPSSRRSSSVFKTRSSVFKTEPARLQDGGRCLQDGNDLGGRGDLIYVSLFNLARKPVSRGAAGIAELLFSASSASPREPVSLFSLARAPPDLLNGFTLERYFRCRQYPGRLL
jgi:hypothetical protein